MGEFLSNHFFVQLSTISAAGVDPLRPNAIGALFIKLATLQEQILAAAPVHTVTLWHMCKTPHASFDSSRFASFPSNFNIPKHYATKYANVSEIKLVFSLFF